MKTEEGWIRGKLCGKQYDYEGSYSCALCGRYGVTKEDLCYPVHFTYKIPEAKR